MSQNPFGNSGVRHAFEKSRKLLWVAIGVAVVIVLGAFFLFRTEVIKNPEPIKIGDITLAPKEIIKHATSQEWKDVAVQGPGGNGRVEELNIGRDWLVAANLSFDRLEISKMEIKDVAGGWEKTLAEWEKYGRKSGVVFPTPEAVAQMPQFKADTILLENVRMEAPDIAFSIKFVKLRDCDFPKEVGDTVIRGIHAYMPDHGVGTVADVLLKGIHLPEDGDLESMEIRNLKIQDMAIPDEGIKVRLLEQDMRQGKYHLAIDGFQLGKGRILAQIPNAPKEIKGDAAINALLKNKVLTLEGNINLDNLADIKGKVAGRLEGQDDFDPKSLAVDIRDKGLVKMLTPEIKGMMLLLGGQFLGQGFGEFLATPGKTMKITGDFAKGVEKFKVKVN